MKNKKRKLSLLLALVLGTTPILTNINQNKSYAKENNENSFDEFLKKIDQHIIVSKNNFFEIKNEEEIKTHINKEFNKIKKIFKVETEDEIFKAIEKRLEDLNNLSKNNKIIILKNKQIFEKNKITFRSANSRNYGELSYFWWGTRRTFSSSNQAYGFANNLRDNAEAIDLVTLIFGTAVGVEAVFGFLTTLYLKDLAHSVEKWAKSHPYGFKLDISWSGYYTLKD